MIKNLPSSFLIFFFVFSAFSQDKSEEYLSVIDTTQNITLKLNSIDSLLTKYWEVKNFDDFINQSENYLKLAEENNMYDEMAKKAMNLSYPLINIKDNPKKAITILNSVIQYEDQLTDSFLKGGVYLKRGGAFFNFNLTKAIEDYTLAIEKFKEKDGIYIADAHLFRGQAYSGLGQFVAASEDYKKAYDYFEKEKDYEYMLHARSGEIIMYSKNGFLEKSITQREQLIEDLKKLNLHQYLTSQYYNQSIDYKKLKNYPMRLEYLEKALTFADSTNQPAFNYTAIYSSLSDHFSITKNLQNASFYLKRAEEFLPKVSSDIYANSIYLMALIEYQNQNGLLEEAKVNALKRIDLLDEMSLDEETINTHQTLSEIYFELGDYQNAFEHLNLFSSIKDSLYNQTKTNALVYYQTLYETERKEKELFEKKSNIAILEEKNDALKKQYLFGGVTLTLGFILLFLYKNQRDLKNKKELQEKYTQDLLIAQEDERKRVSKDLHDGVGQSLLLIKNKVVLIKDDSTKNLVENAIEEVRSISRALHPFQLQEMGITKAIQNIIYQIDESTELFITSEIASIDGLFNIQQEVNIFRIVQESFNNVIKHSEATSIQFDLTKEKNNIKIKLTDNGKGFDFSERYKDFNSLGLKTLKERTRFLSGVMKVDSQTNKGTRLEFIIPYYEK